MTITYFPDSGDFYRTASDYRQKAIQRQNYLASTAPMPEGTREASAKDWKFRNASAQVAETVTAQERLREIAKEERFASDPEEIGRLAAERAYIVRSAAVNDTNAHQLTRIQFVRGIIGQIMNYLVAAKGYETINTPSLLGSIPEAGVADGNMQVEKLSRLVPSTTEFGGTDFRVRRNEVMVYLPKVTAFESNIPPWPKMVAGAAKQLAAYREVHAVMTLSKLGNLNGGSSVTVIANPLTSTANVVPNADNDTIGDIIDKIQDHALAQRNDITKIWCNPVTLRQIEINWFAKKSLDHTAPKGPGVFPFPGLDNYGVTAYSGYYVPKGRLYFGADEGFYELNGPKDIDEEYSALQYANLHISRDFIGYLAMNPGRYGFKATVGTAATEVTTIKAAAALVKRPKVAKKTGAEINL